MLIVKNLWNASRMKIKRRLAQGSAPGRASPTANSGIRAGLRAEILKYGPGSGSGLKIAGLRKPGLKIAGLRKPGLQNRRAGQPGPVPIPGLAS